MDRELDAQVDLQRRMGELLVNAFEETAAAVFKKLAEGRRPRPVHDFPTYALHNNGMPSLGDDHWSGHGPLEYCSLLDPPYSDETARRIGRFPAEQFPRLEALVEFCAENPVTARIPEFEIAASPMTRIGVELMIARAVDFHFLRYGEVAVTADTRAAVLRPMLRSLVDEQLQLAVLAPIAMVHFDFERLRLGPKTFIMRMSPGLQKARWAAKAYGANGHDQVLSAATHCFVLTDWVIPNTQWLERSNNLGQRNSEVRHRIDTLFAALRLETGVDTGYAQEVRLSRRWRYRHNYGLPDVHTVGARSYPEHFDDWRWNADEFPIVEKAQMLAVSELIGAIDRADSDQLALAIRRLNTTMMRADVADAVLDATIAMEILLGDGNGQAISWKLRMRAAALAGLGGDRAAAMAMHSAISEIYAVRSAIVHGAHRRKRKVDERGEDKFAAKDLAISTLRTLLKLLVQRQEFLDPLRIDSDLLISPPDATP